VVAAVSSAADLLFEALSPEDAERLADRFDRRLLRLERDQARALITELRRARDAILARIAARGEIDPGDLRRQEELLREIDVLIGELQVRLGEVVQRLPELATAVGDEYGGRVLGARIIGTFSVLNRPALVTLQRYNLGLISRVTDDLRADIRRELLQGIIQGESVQQIARRLTTGTALQRGVFARVETRAEVIARTETIRSFNQGALWQFQLNGVKRVVWMTARDDRTCPYCRPLDGQVFPIDRLPLGGPPIHPRCRCMVRPDIQTDEQVAKARDREAVANYWREQKRLTERPKRSGKGGKQA